MHYKKSLSFLILIWMLSAARTWSQPPTDMVRAKLIADVSAVTPGRAFSLGVLFEMKPEWHIYWHNPGESGLATSIRFELPEGASAGPILWPAPTRFDQPGGILGYGYAESVLLAAKVNVKQELSRMDSLPIKATARWLSCKEVCIPGGTDLELNLPLSDLPQPANEALFSEWEAHLPVEAFSAGVQVETTGGFPEDSSAADFTITLSFNNASSRVDWFPYAEKALRITERSIESSGKGARIVFKAEILKGHELSFAELPSVVTFTQGGENKAVRVSVPLIRPSRDPLHQPAQ